jgi:sugar lactone lactonase YvrE
VYYDEYFQGILYRLPPGSSTPQVLQTGLDYPNFMSTAADGTVFFVTGQTCGDKIVRFNPSTGTITTILTAPTPHDTDHGFGGLFIHPSGDLYYTTCQYNTINRLPAGTVTPQVVLNAPYPSGISVDNQGNLFYTLYMNGIDVLPYGSTTPLVIASGLSAYGHQMALDSKGDIFYTASDGTTIWEIPVTSPATIAATSTLVPTQTNEVVTTTEVVASADQGQRLLVTTILVTVLIASLALLTFILTRRRRR